MPVISIPAPSGGINGRDSLAAMPPNDAISLIMVPRGTYVEDPPPVESPFYATAGSADRFTAIMPFETGSTNVLLVSYSDRVTANTQAIATVNTTSGALTDIKAGWANTPPIWTMFQNRMIICNGSNTAQVYDGASIADIVVSGVSASTLRGVVTFKGRAYYWKDNDQAFWYAAAGAYQGALTEYRFDTFVSGGGKLLFIATFTRDGGEGADDLLILAMSTGELLVYQGDDPGSASAWQLVGKFKIPAPIGARSWVKLGGDALIMTIEGIVSIGGVLSGTAYPLFSDKIGRIVKKFGTISNPDLVTLTDFPETNSIVLTTESQIGEIPVCYEKSTGAWWYYYRIGTPTSVWGVFQGVSYFATLASTSSGAPFLFRVAQEAASTTITAYASERSVAYAGTSFSVRFLPILTTIAVYTDFSQQSDSYTANVMAYVTPAQGMICQLTSVKFFYDTVTDAWPTAGAGSRDKNRWYQTNLRLKFGGKR